MPQKDVMSMQQKPLPPVSGGTKLSKHGSSQQQRAGAVGLVEMHGNGPLHTGGVMKGVSVYQQVSMCVSTSSPMYTYSALLVHTCSRSRVCTCTSLSLSLSLSLCLCVHACVCVSTVK